ncbi:hypothetical protein PT276_00705 [Orbaceae bacterium ESL0721]|nr:hypothetical protein [Orbaceae bacterium ESL0721]
MMLLTYIFYYIISIFTLIIGIYFCRFTEEDYANSPSLKRKKRYVVIWIFVMMLFLQGYVTDTKTLFIYPVTHPAVRFFAILFAISYAILLGKITTPKPTRKKKFK